MNTSKTQNVSLPTVCLYQGNHQLIGHIDYKRLPSDPPPYCMLDDFINKHYQEIDPIYNLDGTLWGSGGYSEIEWHTLPAHKEYPVILNVYLQIDTHKIVVTLEPYNISPYKLYVGPARVINQMIQDPRDPDNYLMLLTTLDYSKYRYTRYWFNAHRLPRIPEYYPKLNQIILVCENLETETILYCPLRE